MGSVTNRQRYIGKSFKFSEIAWNMFVGIILMWRHTGKASGAEFTLIERAYW